MKWIMAFLLIFTACEPDNRDLLAPKVARTNTVQVFSAPATLSQADTRYILQNDVSAPGTAFTVTNSQITLDLNGFTVTYDDSVGSGPVYGVLFNAWGKQDLEVIGGTIQQSAAVNPADSTLTFRSPIKVSSPNPTGVILDALTLKWRSAQTHAVEATYTNDLTVRYCTFSDEGWLITNRHQMRFCVANTSGNGAWFHNNTITRTRHGGFLLGNNAQCNDNNIHIDSYATNAFGILAFGVSGFSIHNNIITSEGAHNIGIGFEDQATNGSIYNNTLNMTTTRRVSPHAVGGHGIRTTWGADEVEVWGNDITVHGELGGVDDGSDAWGQGLWVGAADHFAQPDRVHIHDNTIRAVCVNNGARAIALSIVGNPYTVSHENYLIENNVLESGYIIVALNTSYGGADGYPLLIRNTLTKVGNWNGFRTITEENHFDPPSTGFFVNNTYGGSGQGADFEDMWFNWNDTQPGYSWCGSNLSKVDVRKGWELDLLVTVNGTPAPLAQVAVYDNIDGPVFDGFTDGTGHVSIPLEEYRITNCPDYPLPSKVTLNYLDTDAHKVNPNPHEIWAWAGGTYGNMLFTVTGNGTATLALSTGGGGGGKGDPPAEP